MSPACPRRPARSLSLSLLAVLLLSACQGVVRGGPEAVIPAVALPTPAAQAPPAAATAGDLPIYLWFEPEWFVGVEGRFDYWTGPGVSKPTGHWGVAGPGISAEFSQGGESEWNSMGAAAEETKALCRRSFTVPRAGKYRLWVRYVDHRQQTEPFRVGIRQGGSAALDAEMGIQEAVTANDEYQLYWGFTFAWAGVAVDLKGGPAQLSLAIDKAGQNWRQIDAVLLTSDLDYAPMGRAKPHFAWYDAMTVLPGDGAAWRGTAAGLSSEKVTPRKPMAGRDFSMWVAGKANDQEFWKSQNPTSLSVLDFILYHTPPADIRKQFLEQFAGRKDIPVNSWPGLVPGFYLGEAPDLSPGTPVFQWLEASKTPFYIMTNYANPKYDKEKGPATYAALTGPLAEQFLGYIHGEAIGTVGTPFPKLAAGASRRDYVNAIAKELPLEQGRRWSGIYNTDVPASHFSKSISCLSCESIAVAHAFHHAGAQVVGYELDATNAHVPMRIAFERGAARQYGGSWINYASGNFGDACNYFAQQPVVPRGAPGWFHSKYAITDGVSASWYRKLYYLNYLGGASAIYWEQSLANQWILPGPGKHPVQLSPFGRATQDFQGFVDRVGDRGEPLTPIAFLLSYGHGYERVNYTCQMLNHFRENNFDIELRELFNVAWYPASITEGQPINSDNASTPSGVYGNIFDVLVDRESHAQAVFNYPVLVLAGDVDVASPAWQKTLQEYLARGGTIVVNVAAAKGKLPESLLGVKFKESAPVYHSWLPAAGAPARPATPYLAQEVELTTAKPLAMASATAPLIVRNAVGPGAVIVTLVPHMVGLDERAHPALPVLFNALTDKLLPIKVTLANGQPLDGEVAYQLNRTKDGYLLSLFNNRGVDKTQSGIARVDRSQFADVVLHTSLNLRKASELTQMRDLALSSAAAGGQQVQLRVQAGDIQVVKLQVK